MGKCAFGEIPLLDLGIWGAAFFWDLACWEWGRK